MLDKNLIKIFEQSFREHHDMPALTDYFKKETFTYFDLAQDIAKIHLVFKEAGIERGDKVALIGRNNTRWCVSYLATVTYGAVIVPILQDFNPNDVINIVNHSESKLLFLGDNFWDDIEGDQIPEIKAVFNAIGGDDTIRLSAKPTANVIRFCREIGMANAASIR